MCVCVCVCARAYVPMSVCGIFYIERNFVAVVNVIIMKQCDGSSSWGPFTRLFFSFLSPGVGQNIA